MHYGHVGASLHRECTDSDTSGARRKEDEACSVIHTTSDFIRHASTLMFLKKMRYSQTSKTISIKVHIKDFGV